MSSTMPPDQPTEPSSTSPPRPVGGITIGAGDIARLPRPGNAEFLLWLLLEIAFTLIWWIDDDVDVSQWMTITTALTFGYFISRGIAKASRVLED